MIDNLPIWRDSEVIRGSSLVGFTRQFHKLHVKLCEYLKPLFPGVGLVSVSGVAGSTVGVCSFVSQAVCGSTFECKIVLDGQRLRVRLTRGTGCLGSFSPQIGSTQWILVDEDKSWGDLSVLIAQTVSTQLMMRDLKKQTN